MSKNMKKGGPGGMMQPGEKAKDFKGTITKLLNEMGRFKYALIGVVIFAIASAVFTVVGPKILGNATTEIFTGLVNKISGSGEGINFNKIGEIIIFLLCLYILDRKQG